MRQQFTSLVRSGYQRIFELVLFKVRKEKQRCIVMALEVAAEQWNAKCQMATSSEQVDSEMFGRAVAVFRDAFQYKEVLDAVHSLEEICKGSGPFDTVFKLYTLGKRASNDNKKDRAGKRVVWAFQMVADKVLPGPAQPVYVLRQCLDRRSWRSRTRWRLQFET